MENLTARVKVENIDEQKELLQVATDQVEQLQNTIKRIESFEPLITTVTPEIEDVTATSTISVNPNEFNQLLKSAPMGSVTDEPLPLKPNIVSKEYGDGQFQIRS